MDTASRPNPLAFLAEELAALRERNLYRPLRIMMLSWEYPPLVVGGIGIAIGVRRIQAYLLRWQPQFDQASA